MKKALIVIALSVTWALMVAALGMVIYSVINAIQIAI